MAFLLKQAGHTVAPLERGRCAQVDTGHTTVHVTCVTDLGLTELVKGFGPERTKAVWDAGAAAIDKICALIRAADIDCDFKWVPGFLHAPFRAGDVAYEKTFQKEALTARELVIQAD